MANESIYKMSISDLQKGIEEKRIEYREAIKDKKVFWEVKLISRQRKAFEQALVRKTIRSS